MKVRITKIRVALAALFVLAGVGLGSLLSPLVGSAFATAGQVVNVSDPTAAYTAKVTSAGELKTNGVVSGKVAPALPAQPFNILTNIYIAPAFNEIDVIGPTTATIALTDVQFSNYFKNLGRRLALFVYSAPAPNVSCANTRQRWMVGHDLGPGQTVASRYETPLVLKPLASGDAWCLHASLVTTGSDPDYNAVLSVGGYVLSGSYTPPAGAGLASRPEVVRTH